MRFFAIHTHVPMCAHREALGAEVAHAGACEAHGDGAEDEQRAHAARQLLRRPLHALFDRAQQRALCALEDLKQLLNLAVVGLILRSAACARRVMCE
jgi:hypothetical protein